MGLPCVPGEWLVMNMIIVVKILVILSGFTVLCGGTIELNCIIPGKMEILGT